MPYPTQITAETIITTAIELIEQHGAEAVTLRTIADQLGVKSPSLYRYFENRHALLQAVNTVTAHQLVAILLNADPKHGDYQVRLGAIAQAFRQFAHTHPMVYRLSVMSTQPDLMPEPDLLEQAVLPLQAIFAEIDGDNALMLLRGAYAFLHGWVMLELNGQLRRGGDLDAHFEQAFLVYIEGCLTQAR